MKEYQTKDIRNFAVVGHGGCGKTMLAESMLACGGEIGRLGSVASGSTVSDFSDDERERQISVYTSLLHTDWKGKKINLLDAPGYMDFVGEVMSAIRVVDNALVVIHAGQGAEVGTSRSWDFATAHNLPKFIALNALDKEHVDFDKALAQVKDVFGKIVVPLTYPVNVGPGFNQVLDVLNKKLVTYKTDGTGKCDDTAAGAHQDKIDELYAQLGEAIAESDDALLEKFFADGQLSDVEIKGGLHNAIMKGSLVPLFATAGETNIGVSKLMDFVADYAATPEDKPVIIGHDGSAEVKLEVTNADPTVFVFKTMSDAVGELSFFRVYSGKVTQGVSFSNRTKKGTERFGQIFVMNGKKRENVEALCAGDIGAVVKLKDTAMGDTLTVKTSIEFDKVQYPKPNINMSIKTKNKGDEEKIAMGLSAIHVNDPTFLYRVDGELHQTVISGQGEVHLETVVKRLQRKYNVEVMLTDPRIPFRETIKGKGDSKYRHKKQSGGSGQFAEVHLRVEPTARGEGFAFTNSLVGQNVDRAFVPSVEKGVAKATKEGPVSGNAVVDVKVDFYDGKQHPVDSKDIAFQIAGEQAFREAFAAAKPCLLEPIMKIVVKVPEEFMGDIMGDVSSRRGRILGMDSDGRFQVVRALVPQAELHRYSTTIRSITGGRGFHTEEFDHYEEMPAEMEKKAIELCKKLKEEE